MPNQRHVQVYIVPMNATICKVDFLSPSQFFFVEIANWQSQSVMKKTSQLAKGKKFQRMLWATDQRQFWRITIFTYLTFQNAKKAPVKLAMWYALGRKPRSDLQTDSLWYCRKWRMFSIDGAISKLGDTITAGNALYTKRKWRSVFSS